LWLSGTCKFGDGCRFLHDEKKLGISAKQEIFFFIDNQSEEPISIEPKESVIDKIRETLGVNASSDMVAFQSNP